MPLDVQKELEAIKSHVPPAQRQAAYQHLVRRLEQAREQASFLHLKHRYSVLVHYVKAKAREARDWS